MDTIVLNTKAFEAVTSARGHSTYEQQAEATGISVGTLHRLRAGGPAGPAAIARICLTYGVAFDDVFTFGTVAPAQSRRRPAPRQRTSTRGTKALAA
ncbi:helix-turn-helix domain-containing protein [Streptomyces flaveolus]|uniref:helix-turn-helix domain-containing protein n=1 Tax=Streptomyces flaveolus TaxID=67297 RepID=UPI001670421A|nr:helix-turn-helix transcriptional regulator [Streptomyces flaveolus]GGQ80957.1 hypothetical protein GCM10010216_48490 [Streptomyces flaveolus]